MNQQTKNSCTTVAQQISGVRTLYSRIGEPLPADVLIDLHHYLGTAMQLYHQMQKSKTVKRKKQ